jgi:flavin reductase (DIM6/NTAB) family NADH-FMN oxidoreductase RutF
VSTWGLAQCGSAQVPGRNARREERSDRERVRVVPRAAIPDIHRALSLLPGAPCVMAAAYENRRVGVIVHRVMQCSNEPACVAVALPTGQRLAMLVRDSHSFSLSMVDRSQKLLLKKFGDDEAAPGGDPFDLMDVRTIMTGSPILARCVMGLDCEVVRHYDLEADYEVYIGMVLGAYLGPSVGSGSGGNGAVSGKGHLGESVAKAIEAGHALTHGPADEVGSAR